MKQTFKISGMHCASCVAVVTRALQKVEGVKSAVVNYSTEKAMVEYDESVVKEESLISTVKGKGYGAQVLGSDDYRKEEEIRKKELDELRFRLVLSFAIALPALIIGMFFMEEGFLFLGYEIPYAKFLLFALATPIQFYIGKISNFAEIQQVKLFIFLLYNCYIIRVSSPRILQTLRACTNTPIRCHTSR